MRSRNSFIEIIYLILLLWKTVGKRYEKMKALNKENIHLAFTRRMVSDFQDSIFKSQISVEAKLVTKIVESQYGI